MHVASATLLVQPLRYPHLMADFRFEAMAQQRDTLLCNTTWRPSTRPQAHGHTHTQLAEANAGVPSQTLIPQLSGGQVAVTVPQRRCRSCFGTECFLAWYHHSVCLHTWIIHLPFDRRSRSDAQSCTSNSKLGQITLPRLLESITRYTIELRRGP